MIITLILIGISGYVVSQIGRSSGFSNRQSQQIDFAYWKVLSRDSKVNIYLALQRCDKFQDIDSLTSLSDLSVTLCTITTTTTSTTLEGG
jgi:hypothetical protein